MSAAPPSDTPSPLPRDARLIALLLAASGAEDSDEGVVRMLVEFAHSKYRFRPVRLGKLPFPPPARAGPLSRRGQVEGLELRLTRVSYVLV